MSHYYCLVLLEPGGCELRVKQAEALLAPYDENLEVDEYERRCWCVGHQAQDEIRKRIDDELGSGNDWRERFRLRREAGETAETLDRDWREQFVKPREGREAELLAEHPGRDTAVTDCDTCHGTSIERTTCNPQSKWDWYTVGGRWTGENSEYEPVTDPENYESCSMCGGTGKRRDVVVALAGGPLPRFAQGGLDSLLGKDRGAPWTTEKLQEYLDETGCNGCGGKGRSQLWPTKWKPASCDYGVPVMHIVKRIALNGGHRPFAVVASDGRWHEKGHMGWWGCVSGEKDAWPVECDRLLAEHAECIGMTYDCHI